MNKIELEALPRVAAKSIKTEKDLKNFSQMLTRITVEAALNAELDDHLGYSKHETSRSESTRNGFSKALKTEDRQFKIDTPRDRSSSFEPKLIQKQQTRFTSMDGKVLSLYAQGMSTRDIIETFKEIYGADVSAFLISQVTNSAIEKVVQWQS